MPFFFQALASSESAFIKKFRVEDKLVSLIILDYWFNHITILKCSCFSGFASSLGGRRCLTLLTPYLCMDYVNQFLGGGQLIAVNQFVCGFFGVRVCAPGGCGLSLARSLMWSLLLHLGVLYGAALVGVVDDVPVDILQLYVAWELGFLDDLIGIKQR